MGFFFAEGGAPERARKGPSPEFMRRHECEVCPLNSVRNHHPKMLPTGTKEPTVLIVGEAPGAEEDAKGEQFVGKSGKLLRAFIPDEWLEVIRWTNAVRCRPPNNRTPDQIELDCCFPKLERDVAATKPKAIFGFGATPLYQIVNPDAKYRRMNLWRGRVLPVVVGGHACWYFPFMHPSYVMRMRDESFRSGEDQQFTFALDIYNAMEFLRDHANAEYSIHSEAWATGDVELVYDVDTIEAYLDEANRQKTNGVDLETNGLRPYAAGSKILTMGVSSHARTFAFPVDHSQSKWTHQERQRVKWLIKKYLEFPVGARKIAHHLPFEMEWFGWFFGTSCFYKAEWEDSESQAYVLDPRRGGLSLDFLSFVRFGLRLKELSGLDRANLDNAPLPAVLKYNGIDARYCRYLYLEQKKDIEAQDLNEVYRQQMRRIPSLVLAQMHGVPVDQSVVNDLYSKYKKDIDAAAYAIQIDTDAVKFAESYGKEFNPASHLHVSHLLKKILKVEVENSAKDELNNIDAPIAKKIVTWREASKAMSTYITPLNITCEDNVVFPDNMLHPIISTTSTVTWRTGSNEPNIQNFPNRDERKEVRSMVRSPDRGMRVVSFDYAGIQARNVAMESKDEKLVNAFWHNYDIHSDWRERIVKRYPRWIPKNKLNDKDAMKAFRHLAKNKFVFPAFFGAQAYKLSMGLGIPPEICEELRAQFFDEFPDIEAWHKSLDVFYEKNGYVTGLSGFRRYAPVSPTERINSPIQGDESIIVMDAMCRLSEMEDPRYQAMLMVHDDLTFLWPAKEIEKRAEVVVKTLIHTPFEWAHIVPMEVEMKVGQDWIDMQEVGKYSSDKWDGIIQIPSSVCNS